MAIVTNYDGGTEKIDTEKCKYCKGDSAVVTKRDENGKAEYLSSQDWCAQMKTCAATIDWEKVYGRE